MKEATGRGPRGPGGAEEIFERMKKKGEGK